MEGVSLKRHTSIFCADTIMTTKEIEGNGICGLFAHVGPKIKRMNLTKIVEKEVV